MVMMMGLSPRPRRGSSLICNFFCGSRQGFRAFALTSLRQDLGVSPPSVEYLSVFRGDCSISGPLWANPGPARPRGQYPDSEDAFLGRSERKLLFCDHQYSLLSTIPSSAPDIVPQCPIHHTPESKVSTGLVPTIRVRRSVATCGLPLF